MGMTGPKDACTFLEQKLGMGRWDTARFHFSREKGMIWLNPTLSLPLDSQFEVADVQFCPLWIIATRRLGLKE